MERSYFRGSKQTTIFQWKICDFPLIMKYSMINQDAHTILSRNFPTNWKSKWELKLKFNNDKKSEDKEWISIFLNSRPGTTDNPIFKVKCSLFILDNQKEKKFENELYKVFIKNEDFFIPKFIEVNQLLEKKDKLLPDNSLTICIELTKFIENNYFNSSIFKIPLITSDHSIVDDLKDLFDSRAGSDVELVVGDMRIPAHKTLLMARSPVFFAMFIHKLKENRENKVIIPDMGPDTCEKLLEFIYTDNVTDLDEVAGRLLGAADKYQIPALKNLCEISLCKNVNVENAVQYLILLDRHNTDGEFFKFILDFIAINSDKIIETPEFKALEKTNTKLLLTIVTKICSIK